MTMNYILKTFVILVISVAVIGCIDLPSASEVDKFRVLAVTAEPPEIAPGEGTSLEVLFADPNGDNRKIEFAWIPCAGYVHSSSGLQGCEMLMDPQVKTASDGGAQFEIPFTPPDIMELDVMGNGFIRATFVVLMCAGGTLPKPDEYEDKKDVADINTLCKGGDAISAYKMVTISESDNPQRNPTLSKLTANDKEVAPASEASPFVVKCKTKETCDAEVTLNAFFTKDSRQSYEIIEFDEPVTIDERMYISWFVTAGSVEGNKSGPKDDGPRTGPYETVWHIDEPGEHTLWVVGHDVRGGTTWETYTFNVKKKK